MKRTERTTKWIGRFSLDYFTQSLQTLRRISPRYALFEGSQGDADQPASPVCFNLYRVRVFVPCHYRFFCLCTGLLLDSDPSAVRPRGRLSTGSSTIGPCYDNSDNHSGNSTGPPIPPPPEEAARWLCRRREAPLSKRIPHSAAFPPIELQSIILSLHPPSVRIAIIPLRGQTVKMPSRISGNIRMRRFIHNIPPFLADGKRSEPSFHRVL